MSAAKQAIVLTFKGLLVHYLWQQFPGDPEDDIDLRATRMIRTCNPQGALEETAWREALAACARERGRK